MKEELTKIAGEFVEQGPGYAQEGDVLREACKRLNIDRGDTNEQQKLLTAWHNLFLDGTLSWGYNVDNPSSPFFHLVDRR